MPFNIGYTTLPTFSDTNIGKVYVLQGNFTPTTGPVAINSYALTPGIYIVCINIRQLLSLSQGVWYIAFTQGASALGTGENETQVTTSPVGTAGVYWACNIQWSFVVTVTTAATYNVNLQSSSTPGEFQGSYYNTVTRIA